MVEDVYRPERRLPMTIFIKITTYQEDRHRYIGDCDINGAGLGANDLLKQLARRWLAASPIEDSILPKD